MSKSWKCPNCSALVDGHLHPEDGCAVALLQRVVKDRGSLTDVQVRELARTCDVDALWEALGPVIDRFEAGEFVA